MMILNANGYLSGKKNGIKSPIVWIFRLVKKIENFEKII